MNTPPAKDGRSTPPEVTAADDEESVSIVLMPQVGQRKPRATVFPQRGQTRAMTPPPKSRKSRYPSISRARKWAKGSVGKSGNCRWRAQNGSSGPSLLGGVGGATGFGDWGVGGSCGGGL